MKAYFKSNSTIIFSKLRIYHSKVSFNSYSSHFLPSSYQLLKINNSNMTRFSPSFNFCSTSKVSKVEVVDKEKFIKSLEDGMKNMSDSEGGVEKIELLIKLKREKFNGSEIYEGYEHDLFAKANAYFSNRDFKKCESIIEDILKIERHSQDSSKLIENNNVKVKTLLLKASLI